jgi:hypothetical protein
LKKFMLLGSLVALVVAALALPALAQDRSPLGNDDRDDQRFEQRFDRWQEQADERGFTDDEATDFYLDRFAQFYGLDDEDWWNDDFDEVDPAVSQSFDQQARSGDVNQSFNVSNTGDNSNQCLGIQGVANTGNAQNQTGVIQYGSAADDFSFEDSGATIEVSPTNYTSCDQQVNQAATAYGR